MKERQWRPLSTAGIFRIGAKLCGTSLAAEIVRASRVFHMRSGFRWINVHAAHRIDRGRTVVGSRDNHEDLSLGVLAGRTIEFLFASDRAEVVGLAGMFARSRGFRRIDSPAANWICHGVLGCLVTAAHRCLLVLSLLLTHERQQSYSWLRRQVQSRHLCSAQVPHTFVSCLTIAFRARCRRTDALLAEICSVWAKSSADFPPRSTCSMAVRYSSLRSRTTSPTQAQTVRASSGS